MSGSPLEVLHAKFFAGARTSTGLRSQIKKFVNLAAFKSVNLGDHDVCRTQLKSSTVLCVSDQIAGRRAAGQK